MPYKHGELSSNPQFHMEKNKPTRHRTNTCNLSTSREKLTAYYQAPCHSEPQVTVRDKNKNKMSEKQDGWLLGTLPPTGVHTHMKMHIALHTKRVLIYRKNNTK